MHSLRPRIVFLNRCYWPDSEATGQLLTDLCHQLSDAFEVHVVCGQPNSPLPGAAFLPAGIEVIDGVTIHRLPHTQFAKRARVGRMINLISFYRAADRYLRKERIEAELVVSETDPFMLPIVGARHSKRVGARHVCYLQDIYPDIAEEIGKVKSGLLTKLIRNKLRKAYQSADQLIVLGSCMKDRLQQDPWSIPEDNVCVIPNWADCDAIKPVAAHENPFRQQHGLTDRFVVMHSGNMGLTQRLDVLLRAVAHPNWPETATLVMVGGGASRESLQQQAASLPGLSKAEIAQRVCFLDYQPREKLGESLSAADLHIVSMHEQITGCLCPSKLYGILAAGRPVLAIADQGTDLCRTVNEYELGWCGRPGDVAQIADTVANAKLDEAGRIHAGANARRTAELKFDRSVATKQFQDLLLQLHGIQLSERGLHSDQLELADSTEDSNFEAAPF